MNRTEDPRDQLHQKAEEKLLRHKRVLLQLGTGVGKSRIALLLIKMVVEKNGDPWDIIVPNKRLEQGWKDEIAKWKLKTVLKNKLNIYCYQSLHKQPRKAHMVLDEAHKVTPAKLEYIKKKMTPNSAIIGLSASMTFEKSDLLKQLGFEGNHTIDYSLDRAVREDIVAPYKIDIIELMLDNTTKNIEAGPKGNRYFITEKQGYDFELNKVKRAMASRNAKAIQWAITARMHYLYRLPSKVAAGRKILSMLPKDKKVLIFCSSIAQANAMCEHRFHSKVDDTDYQRFCKGEITRLAVVNSVSEGVNIPELDYVLMAQMQSTKVNAIQKIGRLLRKTSNPDKVGHVIVLGTIGTQDWKWVMKGLSSFDKKRINYISYRQILHKESIGEPT